jgi:hypothetical protein
MRCACRLWPVSDIHGASGNTLPAMILPRKAHAVVFDMDGLILDTEPIYRDAMTSVARDCGLDMPLDALPHHDWAFW